MPEDTVEELINSGDAYFLDIDAPEKTIYLGQTQIDLIEITELSSPEELANYVENCAQFVYTPQEIDKLKASFPESKKKYLPLTVPVFHKIIIQKMMPLS